MTSRDKSTLYSKTFTPIFTGAMFCLQIVYLNFGAKLLRIFDEHRKIFFPDLSIMEVIVRLFLTEPNKKLAAALHQTPSNFEDILCVFCLITIAFSFCAFIWGFLTGKLEKTKVYCICNLPFILIFILIFTLLSSNYTFSDILLILFTLAR